MKYPCNDSIAHGIIPKFMYHAIYCFSKENKKIRTYFIRL